MHYLRISLLVDSDEDLTIIREALTNDLDLSLDGSCKVVNITHDRELANAFVRERSSRTEPEVLTKQESSLSFDVAAVLEHYKLTMPKSWLRKGAPPPKVPQNQVYGEIQGLPSLRGRIVLTNGIMAFMVREDGKWNYVHWNHFIPDRHDMIADLPQPTLRTRVDSKTEMCFAGF
jgi:hypothetical protein